MLDTFTLKYLDSIDSDDKQLEVLRNLAKMVHVLNDCGLKGTANAVDSILTITIVDAHIDSSTITKAQKALRSLALESVAEGLERLL